MFCIWQPVTGTHRKRCSAGRLLLTPPRPPVTHTPPAESQSQTPRPQAQLAQGVLGGQACITVLSRSLHKLKSQPCPSSNPRHLCYHQGQERTGLQHTQALRIRQSSKCASEHSALLQMERKQIPELDSSGESGRVFSRSHHSPDRPERSTG